MNPPPVFSTGLESTPQQHPHCLTPSRGFFVLRTSRSIASLLPAAGQDDHGSMHNILRPETASPLHAGGRKFHLPFEMLQVESLFVLWRTTKLQVYRNWGQRLLSAFYRLKTSYGFASLHNVNQPSSKRDDMPSFFLAETLKCLGMSSFRESKLSRRASCTLSSLSARDCRSRAGSRLCTLIGISTRD